MKMKMRQQVCLLHPFLPPSTLPLPFNPSLPLVFPPSFPPSLLQAEGSLRTKGLDPSILDKDPESIVPGTARAIDERSTRSTAS